MPTTLVPPSWRGRCNEGRKLWMVYDDRADSYFAPLEAGEPTEPLLTGCRVLTKTESVSESVDKITGECLRLQLFFYAHQESTNCFSQTAHRRAAEPRAHSGGGEGGVYPVRRERQPRRHRERGGCWSGNSVSPLSYARRTDRSGLSD